MRTDGRENPLPFMRQQVRKESRVILREAAIFK